jgi:membrane fusion protein (multidrug efflux system)
MVNQMTKYLIFSFLVFLLSCSTEKTKPNNSNTSNSSSNSIPVEGLVVMAEEFNESISLTGSLLASEIVDVAAEITGRITGIHFKEGQYVQKGTILFQLNNAEIKAQLKKAEANLELAQKDYTRKSELRAIKAISDEELDQSNNVKQLAKAELELLQVQLDRHSIRAPFSGKIGIRNVSIGNYINPGMILTRLYQIDPIKIEFAVPEKYASKLQQSGKFTYRVEGFDKEFTGQIEIIDPEINLGTRTIRVRGVSSNSGSLLKSGAFVHIELPIEKRPKAILIPASAVTSDIKGPKILILKDRKIQYNYVTIGTRTEDKVIINSGLSIGDTLITSGLLQLREGSLAHLKE